MPGSVDESHEAIAHVSWAYCERGLFKVYLIYTLKATTKKEYNISLIQVPYSFSKIITTRRFYIMDFIYFF